MKFLGFVLTLTILGLAATASAQGVKVTGVSVHSLTSKPDGVMRRSFVITGDKLASVVQWQLVSTTEPKASLVVIIYDNSDARSYKAYVDFPADDAHTYAIATDGTLSAVTITVHSAKPKPAVKSIAPAKAPEPVRVVPVPKVTVANSGVKIDPPPPPPPLPPVDKQKSLREFFRNWGGPLAGLLIILTIGYAVFWFIRDRFRKWQFKKNAEKVDSEIQAGLLRMDPKEMPTLQEPEPPNVETHRKKFGLDLSIDALKSDGYPGSVTRMSAVPSGAPTKTFLGTPTPTPGDGSSSAADVDTRAPGWKKRIREKQ
jgi:hypothetical protein